MRLPDSWTERLPFLEALEEPWDPIPKAALAAWLIFYILFLYQAARGGMFPHLMDGVFVPIHEGGHLLFRFIGEFVSVAGGTMLQLLVPILLASYFLFHRQAQGVAFCLFFMFEQFLPISIYMADARAQDLPLLSVGSGEDVIHDWHYLFGALGVLDHDIQIASIARTVGWIGMFAVVFWLLWRGVRDMAPSKTEIER
ncbi:MAG: hypothetical protein ACRD5M_13415 [Candidatus Acidiferrales bacterium]